MEGEGGGCNSNFINLCGHSIIEMSKWAEIHLYLMKLGFWKKEMLSKEGESKLGQVDDKWVLATTFLVSI